MREAIISFPAFGIEMNPPAGFDLFGKTIYLYGIMASLGFILGMVYCTRNAPKFGLHEDNIYDAILFVLPMAIVGARAYYVIFNFDLYRGGSLMDMVAIWNGGLAIYGGVIGAVIGVVVFCRIRKIKVGAVLDLVALGFLIGQSIGRWGNFFNREAFGSTTDWFLKMGLFNSFTGETEYHHPTFLYESVWNLIGFILINIFYRKKKFDAERKYLSKFRNELAKEYSGRQVVDLETGNIFVLLFSIFLII